ncbi:hypothetical protein BGX30_003640 [Mortierella sp. GBA39]|nr:hypothetical protein BGX30_003640 [Mortierella sp. GBA39]
MASEVQSIDILSERALAMGQGFIRAVQGLEKMLARNLRAKIIRTVSKIGSQSLTRRNLLKMN